MDAFVRSPSEPVSVVLELAGSLEKVQAEHVGEACRMGDRLAEAILRQTADLLVVWLGNMIDLLEPDAIVLGGGVTELIGPFLDYISEQLPAWTLNPRVNEIPLLRARYGIEAGMAGAAALMFT
jgi:predicted NBD/HSP70 family sugar kinase